MKISILLYILFIFFNGCAGVPTTNSSSVNDLVLKKSTRISVVPAKFGDKNDLRLPDAIETQLLNAGLYVIDRSALAQMINEKGFNLTEIINGEEYFKIGRIINVDLIFIVNAKYGTAGVAEATMKIIDLSKGRILLSTNYFQPRPNTPIYVHFQNIMDTAKEMCKQIVVK